MCGIFGIISGSFQLSPHEIRRYTEQALVVGSLRGSDSAGLFLGVLGGPCDWIKRVGSGEELLLCPEFDARSAALMTSGYVVGHHRYGTTGAVSTDNAHPFSERGVTMVHNGTLRGDYATKKLYERGVDVDSHALCHDLADAGPDEAAAVLGNVSGAYCVVWHDSRDGSVNMARNYDRPLHLFHTRDKRNLIFSSEKGMTSWLVDRIAISATYAGPLPPMEVRKYLPGGNAGTPSVTPILSPKWGGVGQWLAPALPVPTPPRAPGPPPAPVAEESSQALRAVMWSRGITESFRIPFTPLSVLGTTLLPASTKTFAKCAVVGTIDSLQMPAIIHGVNYAGALSMFDGRWLVRPTSVFFDWAGKAMLVCKLVKRPGQWRTEEVVDSDSSVALFTQGGTTGLLG